MFSNECVYVRFFFQHCTPSRRRRAVATKVSEQTNVLNLNQFFLGEVTIIGGSSERGAQARVMYNNQCGAHTPRIFSVRSVRLAGADTTTTTKKKI